MKHPFITYILFAAVLLAIAPTASAQVYDTEEYAISRDDAYVDRQQEQQAKQLSKRQQKKQRIDTRKSETYTVPIFMFSVSEEFGDSSVYVTGVQEVSDARLTAKYDYLYYRSYYSTQFNSFLAASFNTSNQTTSVFFNKDKKKLVKRFLKVMKRYESDPARRVVMVTADRFHFRAVED